MPEPLNYATPDLNRRPRTPFWPSVRPLFLATELVLAVFWFWADRSELDINVWVRPSQGWTIHEGRELSRLAFWATLSDRPFMAAYAVMTIALLFAEHRNSLILGKLYFAAFVTTVAIIFLHSGCAAILREHPVYGSVMPSTIPVSDDTYFPPPLDLCPVMPLAAAFTIATFQFFRRRRDQTT